MTKIVTRIAICLATPLLIAGCSNSVANFNAGSVPVSRLAVSTGPRPLPAAEMPAHDQGGTVGKPLIVFIHGAPGERRDFRHFLASPRLAASAHMVTVDRLGYGEHSGEAEPSLERQAEFLAPILRLARPGQPVMLVGHSLGAPVAAKLAMLYPERVNEVMLIAPALDPNLEKDYRFPNLVVGSGPASSGKEQKKLNAAIEIRNLHRELNKLSREWGELEDPVVVVQGGRDVHTPPAQADFAERAIRSVPLRVSRYPELDHFFPWKAPYVLENELLRELQSLSHGSAGGGPALAIR